MCVVIRLGLSEPSNMRAPYRTGVTDSVCTLLSTADDITDLVQRQSVSHLQLSVGVGKWGGRDISACERLPAEVLARCLYWWLEVNKIMCICT